MNLSLDSSNHNLWVRRVSFNSITVADRELRHSFILGPQQIVEYWPIHSVMQLQSTHAEDILALAPEVVLLGTGREQSFPTVAFMARFLQRGIGIETMDNAAAARTHDLLLSEGRQVVTAFILPEPATPHTGSITAI